jgi:hypothetical protein
LHGAWDPPGRELGEVEQAVLLGSAERVLERAPGEDGGEVDDRAGGW